MFGDSFLFLSSIFFFFFQKDLLLFLAVHDHHLSWRSEVYFKLEFPNSYYLDLAMLLSAKLNNYYGIASHGVVIKLLLNLLCNRLYSDFLVFLIRKCTNQATKYSRSSFQFFFSNVFLSSYNVTFDLSCSHSPVLYNICVSSSKGLGVVTEVWEIFCVLYGVNVCRVDYSSLSSLLTFNYTVPWFAIFRTQWPWKSFLFL